MSVSSRKAKVAPPKKRRRGRPRKDGHRRKGVFVYLPLDLLAKLDAYVAVLREKTPGASRGDVVSEALRAHWRFRRRP